MYEVIGLRNVNFTDQRTGQTIDGLKVFATYHDNDVDGLCCETFFFGRNKFGSMFSSFHVGGHFRVFYNKYGKPDDIEIKD